MNVQVLMEIDPDKHEMWIRVSPVDSEYFRHHLRPGAGVTLHGTVARYESSGGHDDFEGDFLLASDRFQLSAGSLEVVTGVELSANSLEDLVDPTGDTP